MIRSIWFAPFAIVALVPQQMRAQPIASNFVTSFALCKLIKQDPDRLKCFDNLQAQPNTAMPAKIAPSGWEFSEKKNPLDDSLEVTASLLTDDASSGFMLRCREHKFEAFIGLLHTFLGSQDRIKVNFRIGDGQPMEGFWGVANTGKGVFIPDAARAVAGLPDNQTLFVRAFDFQGTPHDALFNLQNISEVRERVARACITSQPTKPTVAQPPRPNR